MREQPGDYREVKVGGTGAGANIRERLAQEHAREEREQQRRRKIAERIEWSPTKKLMTGIFFVLYLTAGLPFLFNLVGLQSMVPVGFYRTVAIVGVLPFSWWKPEPAFWTIGPLAVLKVQLVALIVYALVHVILINVHRAILEARVKVST
ncbi:MAG: hypothetical protein HYU66_13990 [Armatimonadetes bacterium]|nr:hypothetical protein [Armatimonadota bacterium]